MIDHCLVFISIKISYLLTYFELDFFYTRLLGSVMQKCVPTGLPLSSTLQSITVYTIYLVKCAK